MFACWAMIHDMIQKKEQLSLSDFCMVQIAVDNT